MPTEMEMGVALVDIGGGTVDVSAFERAACCAPGVALGGAYYQDLAIILKTSLEEAAGLKERSEVMACPDDDDKVVVIKGC